MSVDAIELRPRTPVALYDAAIRVCATSSGVWALTLPAGALLVAAAINAAEAISHQRDLVLPVLLFTLAWVARAIAQGAACHYLETEVLSATPPSIRASVFAALKRAPALVTASAVLFVINSLLLFGTGGLGFFFAGAHLVGYAAVMRGQGSVLGLYGTCAKLLGPARHSAQWVRLCGSTQLIVFANLHGATALLLAAGSGLMGFELTFAERFASLDNSVWLVALAAITFALFEPLRAATATLMLVDGRVRQEGLDLVAAAEQLPKRVRKTLPLLVALLAAPVFAQSPTGDRLNRLVDECELTLPQKSHDDVEALSKTDPSATNRFLSRVEALAYDEEDCDAAERALNEGLVYVREAKTAQDDANASVARDDAKKILTRPEFENVEPKPTTDDKTDDEPKEESAFSKWLSKLWRDFWEWLFKRDPKEAREPDSAPPMAMPMVGADAVIAVVVVMVVVIVGYVLFQLYRNKQPSAPDEGAANGPVETALTSDPMSALAKPPESWAGLADELAARGEYREAIRHLYLALLSRLHRDGAIDYDPTNSNWDYLRHFKGQPARKAPFRDLTLRFDFAWYGNLDVTSVAWHSFRGVAEPLLTTSEEAPRA